MDDNKPLYTLPPMKSSEEIRDEIRNDLIRPEWQAKPGTATPTEPEPFSTLEPEPEPEPETTIDKVEEGTATTGEKRDASILAKEEVKKFLQSCVANDRLTADQVSELESMEPEAIVKKLFGPEYWEKAAQRIAGDDTDLNNWDDEDLTDKFFELNPDPYDEDYYPPTNVDEKEMSELEKDEILMGDEVNAFIKALKTYDTIPVAYKRKLAMIKPMADDDIDGADKIDSLLNNIFPASNREAIFEFLLNNPRYDLSTQPKIISWLLPNKKEEAKPKKDPMDDLVAKIDGWDKANVRGSNADKDRIGKALDKLQNHPRFSEMSEKWKNLETRQDQELKQKQAAAKARISKNFTTKYLDRLDEYVQLPELSEASKSQANILIIEALDNLPDDPEIKERVHRIKEIIATKKTKEVKKDDWKEQHGTDHADQDKILQWLKDNNYDGNKMVDPSFVDGLNGALDDYYSGKSGNSEYHRIIAEALGQQQQQQQDPGMIEYIRELEKQATTEGFMSPPLKAAFLEFEKAVKAGSGVSEAIEKVINLCNEAVKGGSSNGGGSVGGNSGNGGGGTGNGGGSIGNGGSGGGNSGSNGNGSGGGSGGNGDGNSDNASSGKSPRKPHAKVVPIDFELPKVSAEEKRHDLVHSIFKFLAESGVDAVGMDARVADSAVKSGPMHSLTEIFKEKAYRPRHERVSVAFGALLDDFYRRLQAEPERYGTQWMDILRTLETTQRRLEDRIDNGFNPTPEYIRGLVMYLTDHITDQIDLGRRVS